MPTSEREKKASGNRKGLLPLAIILGLGLAVLGPPGIALASSIKVWSTGETLRSADLNSNFAHIHDNMVGNHGARLTNADVNASAAIAHSKLQTPALIPKAWAVVSASCGSSPCTLGDSSMVTSITRTGAGAYPVTLSYTPSSLNFGVVLTSLTSGAAICYVSSRATSAPHFQVNCVSIPVPSGPTDAAPTDAGFTLTVLDS